MTSSSHLASSALTYLVAASLFESPISIQGITITAVGSLLPDIDAPTSSIGRPFFPLASWINQKVGHRTLTHSLVGLAIFALLMLGLAWILSQWTAEGIPLMHYAWLLMLGYGTHIFVDTFNKTGVELFWPSKLRCVLFYNEKYRIAVASKGDYWFMTVCLILNLGMYPLARDGFTRSLHQAFGDIYSVSMDFKQYGDKNRIWLDLEGVEAISNQKVNGRFEILAAIDNSAVLIERDGVRQIVSRTKPLQIFPDRVRISIGEEKQITTQEINMAGRTLGEIPNFPEAWRVLLYGYVTPVKFTPLSVHEGRYNPISLRLDKLKFDHAEYSDIQEHGLEHVAIREGVLIAKIYRPTQVSLTDSSVEPVRNLIRYVEIRFQPTDQILLEEGNVIRTGQVIGRQDISIEVARLKAEYQLDLKRLQADLVEVEIRLAAAQHELDQVQRKTLEIDSELKQLKSKPLFVKEKLRLQNSFDTSEKRYRNEAEKIQLLEARDKELKLEMTAKAEHLARELERLEKKAQILASFSGKIIRIEQEPKDQLIVCSVFYQTRLKP
ncbi:metal-dependent hydrolase [Acidobacteria bacterium AH-259-D05]|nr:metal-dependent hydrolase [Acidobacteria bacterium AH-259-D05]